MSFFEFMVYGFAIIGAMSVLFFALAFVYLSMICKKSYSDSEGWDG